MTRNSPSIFNQLRPLTIGFDHTFDVFERMFENDFKLNGNHLGNYPPYNIVRTGDYTYDIQLALAGFGKKDIDIEYADNTLTIADDVEVLGAELKDGLLTVELEKIIPEHKKARTITIK